MAKSSRWFRWRGYMDGVEEVARLAGAAAAETEAALRQQFERHRWPASHRAAADADLVRRALDIPFLRDLVQAAWRVGAAAQLRPPDLALQPWRAGEESIALRSVDRARSRGAVAAGPSPAPGETAPARLRGAERALANRTRSVVVLLDRLLNPRNVSAVARTAEALGLQEVHAVQPQGREPVRGSIALSAQRYLDVHWYRSTDAAVEALRGRGYRILAADFGPMAAPVEDVPLGDRVAVALGSEQFGVSHRLRDSADALFYLPTCGFASYLNVSVAAAVALFSVDRRMRREGRRAPLEEGDRAALRQAWYRMLAGSDPERQGRYLAWAGAPPDPAPPPERPGRDEGPRP